MRMLLAAVLLPVFAAAEAGVSVRLAEVSGTVSARASSAAAWTPVKSGVMLAPGGEVRTDPGAGVVLAFSDGNKVRLEGATTFGVEGATTLKTSLRLFSGRIAAWVKRVNKADFTVRHAAGVAAVRGTVFAMEGTETGLSIALFEGALDVVDSFGRPTTMSPGQNASVTQAAGLTGVSSMPPDMKAPAEPAVEAPPAPVASTAPEAPPADVPAETTVPTAAPPSPAQESSTVSPSAP